jgi:hypothetical protein
MKIYINQLSNIVHCFYEIIPNNNSSPDSWKLDNIWSEEFYDIPNIDIIKPMNDNGFFAIYYYKSNNYEMKVPIIIYVLNGIIKKIVKLKS